MGISKFLGMRRRRMSFLFCRLNYDAGKMEALLADLRASTGRPAEAHAKEARLYLDWDQVLEMEASGMTFGNHSHPHQHGATG